MDVRRVVTGHDADGKAVFVSDETGGAGRDHAAARQRVPPAVGRRRRAALPRRRRRCPLTARTSRRWVGSASGSSRSPRPTGRGSRRRRHRRRARRDWTRSSRAWPATWSRTTRACTPPPRSTSRWCCPGTVTLELDDGAMVTLGPGDTVVQNGTRHRWSNAGHGAGRARRVHLRRPPRQGGLTRADGLRRGRDPSRPPGGRAPGLQPVRRRLLARPRRPPRVPVGVLRGHGRGRVDRRRDPRGATAAAGSASPRRRSCSRRSPRRVRR